MCVFLHVQAESVFGLSAGVMTTSQKRLAQGREMLDFIIDVHSQIQSEDLFFTQ